MASAAPPTSLSLSARLTCYLGPPSTILFTSLASTRTGLLSPIAFIPTAIAYKIWHKANNIDRSRRGDLETLVWSFASTGTIGVFALLTAQVTVLTAATRLLFPDPNVREAFMTEFGRSTIEDLTAAERAARLAFSASWQNWVFNTTLSFAIAGLFEEILKLLPVLFISAKAKRRNQQVAKRAYLDYTVTAALAFGVFEGIGFLYAACESAQERGFLLMRTVLERFVAGSTAHVLLAALTGLRATRREIYGDQLSWWNVLTPSILLHGFANSAAFAFSTLEGNVGWIHPTGFWTQVGLYSSVLGFNGMAAWLVWKEWMTLQKMDNQIEVGNR